MLLALLRLHLHLRRLAGAAQGGRYELVVAAVVAGIPLGGGTDRQRAAGREVRGRHPAGERGAGVAVCAERHMQVVGLLDLEVASLLLLPSGHLLQLAPVFEPLDLDYGVLIQRVGGHCAAQGQLGAIVDVRPFELLIGRRQISAAAVNVDPSDGRVCGARRWPAVGATIKLS